MGLRFKKMMMPAVVFLAMALVITTTSMPIYAYYETKSSVIGKFKTLCDAHPTYASYASLGKSTQGRDIWIFRIGNPKGKTIMWDAQLHGDEDMGSEIELLMAKWLLGSNSATARWILSRNYVLFIPVIDVDIFARTNANHVNLNRNFVYGWGASGSSSPSSTEYRGPYAGSEKETQAMRNVFRVYHPEFYVNTHMVAGPNLFSWEGNNATLVRMVKTKITQISSQLSVTPYPITSLSGYGFAVADAGYYFKACAWLLEINGPTPPSFSTLVSHYYPKCLPILIAMCQLA